MNMHIKIAPILYLFALSREALNNTMIIMIAMIIKNIKRIISTGSCGDELLIMLIAIDKDELLIMLTAIVLIMLTAIDMIEAMHPNAIEQERK
jgi:hypothetical protein